MNVTVHLWAAKGGAKGSLVAKGSWGGVGGGGGGGGGGVSSGEIEVPAGATKVSLQLNATAAQVRHFSGPISTVLTAFELDVGGHT